MITKSSFTTNSSSTSYIVAFSNKKNAEGELCAQDFIELLEMVSFQSDDNDVETIGKDRNIQKIIDANWYDNEEKQDVIKKIQSVKDNLEVADIRISYHADAINKIFDILVKNGDIVIIDKE